MDDSRDRDSAFPAHDQRVETRSIRNRTPWNTIEGRVISLVSRKGGVGKTTSAVNLGAALALSGHTVLVVGLDPQCGVCRTLGVKQEELSTGLQTMFTSPTPLSELAQPSPLENLFFVSPRVTSLTDEESFLAHMNGRAEDFAREIDRARNLYDTILIDCPPNLGAPTRAALLASDSFLVPVQAEELCRASLAPLMDFVADFRSRQQNGGGDPAPVLEGLFLTMVNGRTRMGRHVSAQVAEDFGDDLLETAIPRTTRLTEMALKGRPAVIYARTTAGSRAYFNLADEIVARFLGRGADTAAAEDPGDQPQVSAQVTGEESIPPAMSATGGGAAGGLDRLLADLGRTNDINRDGVIAADPPQPEMVSLDDLLAEEEQQSGLHEGRDEDRWSFGIDPEDTVN